MEGEYFSFVGNEFYTHIVPILIVLLRENYLYRGHELQPFSLKEMQKKNIQKFLQTGR